MNAWVPQLEATVQQMRGVQMLTEARVQELAIAGATKLTKAQMLTEARLQELTNAGATELTKIITSFTD